MLRDLIFIDRMENVSKKCKWKSENENVVWFCTRMKRPVAQACICNSLWRCSSGSSACRDSKGLLRSWDSCVAKTLRFCVCAWKGTKLETSKWLSTKPLLLEPHLPVLVAKSTLDVHQTLVGVQKGSQGPCLSSATHPFRTHRDLGQKSKVAERKLPEFFEFSPRILPPLLLEIFPKFFDELSCFVSLEMDTWKNFT